MNYAISDKSITITTSPENRKAGKDDPKCTDCGVKFCTYNEFLCLKCHNKIPNECIVCHKKKFTHSDDKCSRCREKTIVIPYKV